MLHLPHLNINHAQIQTEDFRPEKIALDSVLDTAFDINDSPVLYTVGLKAPLFFAVMIKI